MKLTEKAKYGIIVAVSSLFITYAHLSFSYKLSPFSKGLFNFFGQWIIHYFILAILSIPIWLIAHLFYSVLSLNKREMDEELTDVVIYISSSSIVFSIIVLIFFTD